MQKPDMVMTVSGELVWFSDPSQTKILWEDLDWYLPGINRYNGGTRWTLLHHTALVVQMVDWLYPTLTQAESRRLKQLLACHDLHECYVGDIVSGLKDYLPGFREIEQLWSEWVHLSLGVSPPTADELKLVKHVDLSAILYESYLHAPKVYKYLMANNQELGEPLALVIGLAQTIGSTPDSELLAITKHALDLPQEPQ